MVRGHSAIQQTDSMVSGKKCWLAYAPLPSTGWSLGIYFPQDEVLADLMRLSQLAAIITAVGFVFLLVVIIAIAGSITRPLRSLAAATHSIGAGQLDTPLPHIRTRDEVGELAGAFVYMRDALRQYIRTLTEATAARERIESELKIANEIQLGIVPRVSAEFAERPDLDLCAVLQPARQVGGDLYDFFCIDHEHLCLVIGDVSGKGVPAALLMAETHALVRMAAKTCVAPDRILAQINAELARDNEACMFVTLFCAVMDTRTGNVVWANGGHNPPLLLRPGRDAAFLDGPTGPALGILQDATFASKRLELQPGDALVMYTDGITEAFNNRDELFSDERLQALISAHPYTRSRALVERIVQAVNDFAGETPQSDDITLLVVRSQQTSALDAPGRCTLFLRNDLAELRRLAAAIDRFGASQALSQELVNDLQLVLEEVVANIMSYGYEEGTEGEIRIAFECSGDTLVLTVTDDARAFNPLAVPAPDMNLPHEERPIGGLGVFLVRQLMDDVRYVYEGGRNVLTMTKRIRPPSS
jgi:sigma-B regulation protein RsbU (phosphoserine phosphatase)